MNIWLTSDSHLSHEPVAGLRGFDTPAEHDEVLVERWNEYVAPKDQVWHLGDVAMGGAARWGEIVDRLNGTKHLIAGNHDSCHPMYRNAHTRMKHYLAHFATVASAARRRVEGQEILLSHFPYDGDTEGRPNDRHEMWRLRDVGVPLVHGHTHRDRIISHSLAGALQLHVGWDAFARPVHIDEIAYLLRLGV